MAVPRTRPGNYPSLLSYGFRPFFLGGALWGALAVLLWVPILTGAMETRSLLVPVDWHAHELIYGYLPAIVTGFLLTAIPNWTGRLPVQGLPLALLALLWLAGRVAIWFSADIGWIGAMLVDCAFLLAVAAAAAIEIVAGKNWRNLKVLAPVTLLWLGNVVFHIEAHLYGVTDISRRLGIAAGIILIMIIGGRIIPSFTRNWLVKEAEGRLPVPFNRFDGATILLSGLGLGLWVAMPERPETGILLLLGGIANLLRLARWAGERTLRNPLLLILHAAYLLLPLGMLASGLSALDGGALPPAAGIHLFGVGAIGAMTLAVMARATLGHTGRDLHAGPGTCLVFLAILIATPLRFAAALMPQHIWLLHASATFWVLAFAGFVACYGAALTLPKRAPRKPSRVPA